MTDHPTIGASQISAILGIHPKLTQHQVWTKLVHGVEQEDNEDMARGREWELDVLAKYERLTGTKVIPNRDRDGKQKSKTKNFLHATPDAFLPNVQGDRGGKLIEAKTSSERWDVLPAHYYQQAQVQLYCWPSYDTVDVAAMFAFFGYEIFPDIKPDLDLQEKLNAEAEKFIKDYVLPKRLPPIDHTEACRGAIVAQWPTETSQQYLETNELIDKMLVGLHEGLETAEELERSIELQKNALRFVIGERAGIKSALARVDFKHQNGRTTIDHKAALNDLWPSLNGKAQKLLAGLLEKHTRVGQGPRMLRIYWNKDKGDDGQRDA